MKYRRMVLCVAVVGFLSYQWGDMCKFLHFLIAVACISCSQFQIQKQFISKQNEPPALCGSSGAA